MAATFDRDPSTVPPGQIVTHGWPVLHAGTVPAELTPATWTLAVHGRVGTPLRLRYSDLLALPQKSEVVNIHCVTSWTKLGMRWEGVPFSAIADGARPEPDARFVVMECAQGFTTSLPLDVLRGPDVLLAHHCEGTPLPAEHGGPVRMLVPHRYFYKSAKWLLGLKFLAEDELGFWEQRGYSNLADPWAQTRYDVDDVRAIQRMRKAALFRPVEATRQEGRSSGPEPERVSSYGCAGCCSDTDGISVAEGRAARHSI